MLLFIAIWQNNFVESSTIWGLLIFEKKRFIVFYQRIGLRGFEIATTTTVIHRWFEKQSELRHPRATADNPEAEVLREEVYGWETGNRSACGRLWSDVCEITLECDVAVLPTGHGETDDVQAATVCFPVGRVHADLPHLCRGGLGSSYG